jgi:DNA-binding SARP family transcriptional activator
MTTPRLSILVLGPPVITLDGKHIKISRRQQRAGLFYLASEMQPVNRTKICEIFWPEEPESLARKHLREGLSRLRSELYEHDVIVSENDTLSLDPNLVYVDGREYTEIVTPLLNSSEMNSSGKLPDWTYAHLRRAIKLCRGDIFLQGISLPGSRGFEDWVSTSNHSFDFSRQKILSRLADHCISIGNIDEAILWLGRAISSDPLNPDLNYLILSCLKERGRIKEAADYIMLLEHLYSNSSNEELPQSIKSFRSNFIDNNRELTPEIPVDFPGSELHPVPFIGRQDLLKRLNHAFHRNGIVVVRGESGSGKTRLVQEFYSRLDFKPRLLFFIGKPMMVSSPFSILIDGLRREVKPEEWLSLPSEVLNELYLLFPENIMKEDQKQQSMEEFLNLRSSEPVKNALCVLFEKLAKSKKLLMVVDIAQWCDDATIEFFSYLSERNFFKSRGSFILISRQEEVNPLLEIFIDRSVLANQLEKIKISPLSKEETTHLTSIVLGRDVNNQLVEKLLKDTGGNPFFIIESLRAIKELSIDISHYTVEDLYPIPQTVRALVNERTRLLKSETKTLLQSAAILGQRFQPEVLDQMVSLGQETFVNSLEELQRSSILIVDEDVKPLSGYEFPHDQVREILLQELSPARKRNLHLAAVKAIHQVQGDLPELASVYAHHYEQAGEFVSAFESWIKTGRFARSLFSKSDTYKAYNRALELVPRLPLQFTIDLVYQLVVEFGDYAYDLSDIQTCDSIYKECLEIGESNQNPLLIGTGFSGLARVCEMTGQIEKGIELINRALFFLSQVKAKGEEIEAYARMGILAELSGKYEDAIKIFESTLQRRKDYSDKRGLDAFVNIETQLSILYSLMGWPLKAEVIATTLINDCQLIPRRSSKVQAGAALALAQFFTAKYKKSVQTALEVTDLAKRLGLRWWLSFLELVLAKNHLALGSLDKVWILTSDVMEREENFKDEKFYSQANAIFGDLYRLLGDSKSAESYLLKGSIGELNNHPTLENLFLLGLIQIQTGDYEKGFQTVDKTIKNAEELGLMSIGLPARMAMLMMNPEQLSAEEYHKALTKISTEMKERGFGSASATADLVEGEILFNKGEIENASVHFTRAAAFGRSIGNLWFELKVYPYLLKTVKEKSDVQKQIKIRVKEIYDAMSIRATLKPISILLKKHQKAWEGK